MEQQPQRVAVGGDRPRAGLQLAGEAVAEERWIVAAISVIASPPGVVDESRGVREQLRRGGQVPVAGDRVAVPEVG